MDIVISDDLFEEILTPLGIFEDIVLDDLNISKATIIKRCITPALREYYRWNPIKTYTQYPIKARTEIDFPDEFIFTVLNANFNTANLTQGQSINYNNPFYDSLLYSNSSTSKFGTKYDYGLNVTRRMTSSTNQSLTNDKRNQRVDIDKINRKVFAYSNVQSDLTICWGSWNNDVDRIPFSDLDDFIDLASAKTCRMIGMQRGQLEQLGYDEFNFQLFIDEAERLEEKVLAKFKENTKITILSN